MIEEKLVPELRFVDESWTSEKLGNLCEITMGQSPSSKNYSENSADTILIQGNADLINGKVVPRIYTSEITKLSNPGDIILTVRAPVGDLAINEFNSCIGRGVCSIKGNKFIYYFLQSLKNKHVWERFSQGSTFESINSNDIKNLNLRIPSENTQNNISEFLTRIDEKVELLEKKHESYLNFKKYLMQQIFTQKLRFSNEDWGSEKLGKLCKITMGQSPSSKNYSENPDDTVLIQGNADIIGGKIVPRVYTSQITKTSKPGDIILTVRAPVGDLAINEFNSCIGRGVCSIEGDKFIYYSLQSLKEKHIWERFSQGSTFESINSNDIKNLKINIPSKSEQQKIVTVLSNADNKIELLHQNITDIKKFKRGLLQQMFI